MKVVRTRGEGFLAVTCRTGATSLPSHCQPKPGVDERPGDALAVLLAHPFAAGHRVPARPHVLFEVVDDPSGFLPVHDAQFAQDWCAPHRNPRQ